jgi:hypothetical protein
VAVASDRIGIKGIAWRDRVGVRLVAAIWVLGSATLSTAPQAQPAYDAQYVTETVPPFIEFQTPASASVTMQNTGTAT